LGGLAVQPGHQACPRARRGGQVWGSFPEPAPPPPRVLPLPWHPQKLESELAIQQKKMNDALNPVLKVGLLSLLASCGAGT
jgi:hypothetical protein